MAETLGQILQQMGPGNVQGVPNMTPWYMPVPLRPGPPQTTPVPTPAPDPAAALLDYLLTPEGPPKAKDRNANVAPNDSKTMTRVPNAQPSAYPGNVEKLIQDILPDPTPGGQMKDRNANVKPNDSTTMTRVPNANPSKLDETIAAQNFLPQPGAEPYRPWAGLPPPAGIHRYPMTFEAPSSPNALGEALMQDSNIPLPEKKAGAAQPASTTSQGKASKGGATPPTAQSTAVSTAPTSAPPSAGASGPLLDRTLATFLLQTGLNLMVPQWGGPLSQIGQAVGAGAEAVGRQQTQDQQTKLTNQKLDLERQRIAQIGRKKGASESSSSKRLKEKTPMQSMIAGMSPEAGVFLQQRMKDLNKLEEGDDGEGGETADAKFEQIMQQAQVVDKRARGGRGQLRSEEISDDIIKKAAGDPNVESQALMLTAADPAQRALVIARIQAAKGTTNAAGTAAAAK